MQSARAYGLTLLATLLAFVVLDATWIAMLAARFFQSRLGSVLRPEPLLGAVIAFYVIYAVGLVGLAVRPSLADRSMTGALGRGALLGLTAFGTFDLTALALIQGWPLELALVDMAWGVLVSAVAAAAGWHAGSSLTPRGDASHRSRP